MSPESGHRRRHPVVAALALCLLASMAASGCRSAGAATAAGPPAASCSLDDDARTFADLVAAMARRDRRSVDSPTPPPREALTAGLLISSARDLRRHVSSVHDAPADRGRVEAFTSQLGALEARAEQIAGAPLSYSEQMTRLLGNPPVEAAEEAEAIEAARSALAELDALVPGRGTLAARVAEFDRRFVVSPDRLTEVVNRAVALCRNATLRYIDLPPQEQLEIDFADGGIWSGFSRYQGNGRSTISINPRYPLTVDRILDLACHEGYPGHHVINVLRDRHLVQERGWSELGLVLTFSPMSYAAEALASAAPGLAFSEAERIRMVRDELFPLAGLDRTAAGRAEHHVRVNGALSRLDAATAGAIKAYLLGNASRHDTIAALRRGSAMARPEATLQFIDEYRAYATAYTAGRLAASRLIASDPDGGFGPDIRPSAAGSRGALTAAAASAAADRAGSWRRYTRLALQLTLAHPPARSPSAPVAMAR